MAQKPLAGTVEQNIDEWGTGGLNIDDCRVEYRNAADEAEMEAPGIGSQLRPGDLVLRRLPRTEVTWEHKK